eukprot:5698139-Pyramimonas_sp.AAC.1
MEGKSEPSGWVGVVWWVVNLEAVLGRVSELPSASSEASWTRYWRRLGGAGPRGEPFPRRPPVPGRCPRSSAPRAAPVL